MQNHWAYRSKEVASRIRIIVLLLVMLVTVAGIYIGTSLVLQKLEEYSSLVYLSPVLPLSAMFLFLFGMLLLSATVSAIGVFFMSNDNELLLASPISRYTFFISKFLTILVSTSWMPIGFMIPLLLAFGIHYRVDPWMYVTAPFLLLPFFAISSSLATILAHIITILIPPSRLKWLIYLAAILFFFLIFKLARLAALGVQADAGFEYLVGLVSQLTVPSMLWLPSRWIALGFGDFLLSEQRYLKDSIILLWSAAVFSCSGAFVVFSLLFSFGIRGNTILKLKSSWLSPVAARLLKPLSSVYSAQFLLKDFRLLCRDTSQILQLVLLLIIYAVYLSHIQIFGIADSVPYGQFESSQVFFFIMNASIGAFITTAATARLVFPALSLEGQAFWILQTAPISMKQVLKRKFWLWYPMLGSISCFTFVSGGLALGAAKETIISTFLVSWIMSGSIISLGLALGAYFAKFDWEHSAELVASFGSFVFMILSILTIFLTMGLLGLALFGRDQGMIGYPMSEHEWNVFVGTCIGFLLLLNGSIIRFSFTLGEKSLMARM